MNLVFPSPLTPHPSSLYERALIQLAEDIAGRTVKRAPMPLHEITLRGGAKAFSESTEQECMLAGPADTGKTYTALHKVDCVLRANPGAQATVVRKVRVGMEGNVLRTYRRLIDARGGVRVYGGEQPHWYDYDNGSRLWVAGLDNPGKALSSERDLIYVNQAEELQLDDWQTLLTRVTGRGAVVAHPQLIGDCNPGPPHHWIKHRASLRLLESRHEDNPDLFDENGVITEQGKQRIGALDSLEGVLRERLRYGKWVSAEGAVYAAFDIAIHVIAPFPIPAHWRRYRAIDFGYTNPFVCIWAAVDDNGRVYIYREVYMTGRTVDEHAADIALLSTGEHYVKNLADHDAEDRATLHKHGIHTQAAYKALSPGIQAVQKRLRKAGDGKPRLYIFSNCLVQRDEELAAKRHPISIVQEFDAYVWPKDASGRPLREVPVDMYNHGLDAGRYLIAEIDGLRDAERPKAAAQSQVRRADKLFGRH